MMTVRHGREWKRMIKIELLDVTGFVPAIHGMRNPKNSWDKSDSFIYDSEIGCKDLQLATALASAGAVHGKFRRMIQVYMDITAPLYWWKEFDTYKVGTVANSCSTMHKIAAKEFTMDDFSHEHLELDFNTVLLENIIHCLNVNRDQFNKTKDKTYWWHMIQLLPSSYNQKRTVMLNYETISQICFYRKDHKLDEWREFVSFCQKELPYPELFLTGVFPANG